MEQTFSVFPIFRLFLRCTFKRCENTQTGAHTGLLTQSLAVTCAHSQACDTGGLRDVSIIMVSKENSDQRYLFTQEKVSEYNSPFR